MSDAKMTEIILVTPKSAFVTTFCLLVVSPPIAGRLSQGRSWTRSIIEALVALPLVLPPTVLGFYLLLLMAPDAPIGRVWMAMTGTPLSFSFSALVVGS